jgi:hypothetical protein
MINFKGKQSEAWDINPAIFNIWILKMVWEWFKSGKSKKIKTVQGFNKVVNFLEVR